MHTTPNNFSKLLAKGIHYYHRSSNILQSTQLICIYNTNYTLQWIYPFQVVLALLYIYKPKFIDYI